jgi:hypothetical protein
MSVLVLDLMIPVNEAYTVQQSLHEWQWMVIWKDSDSSGNDMVQGTTSAVVWRDHGKAPKLSDMFVS